MALQHALYKDVRDRMRPGDVIAFGGKGNFSEIIKWATRAPVSHLGVVLQSKLLVDGAPGEGYFNQIIESTSLNGFSGVSISRLSDRISTYPGEIWWLPLSEESQHRMNTQEFFSFMLHQEHKPYDMPQAIKSALDTTDNVPLIGGLTLNEEDMSRFFCSELVAAGLEQAGVVKDVNSSEVTPIDLCMFDIYSPDYTLMKGERKEIGGHNSTDPTGWGQ